MKEEVVINWIKRRDGWGLNHLVILDSFDPMLKHESFKSIRVVELVDFINLPRLNDFLGWNVIVEEKLLSLSTVTYIVRSVIMTHFVALGKLLCQNITKLLDQQIPIDIKIGFLPTNYANNHWVKKLYDSYLPIYSSYYETDKFLSKYHKPKCHIKQSCLPRD